MILHKGDPGIICLILHKNGKICSQDSTLAVFDKPQAARNTNPGTPGRAHSAIPALFHGKKRRPLDQRPAPAFLWPKFRAFTRRSTPLPAAPRRNCRRPLSP